MKNNEKSLLIIPAYNEEKNLECLLDEVEKLDLNLSIIVLDDGSSDGTIQVVKKKGVDVISHVLNLGGGACIKTGFKIAINENFPYIITMDADGQHDPSEIPHLLNEAQFRESDLVIGSRFLQENNHTMEYYRKMGIILFSKIISRLSGTRITDATSGYRVYKTSSVKDIYNSMNENQYYALETILKLNRYKHKIVEYPVGDIRRNNGKSKKGVFKYLYNLTRVVLTS